MRCILFLDIDGVMVLENNSEGIYDHSPFDKGCVKVLNDIIDKTSCEIIISSTWKHFFSLKEMQEIFSWNGVNKVPIGFTPNYDKKLEQDEEPDIIKCHEITQWLSKHGSNDTCRWCVTDDWDLSYALKNFVRCRDNKKGLKLKGVSEKIISYLKI